MPEDILQTILSFINPTEETLSQHIEKIEFILKNLKKDCIHDEKVKYIYDYVVKLNKKQINNILCQYGFSEGIQLFYQFHRHNLGYSYSDICEYFELNDFPFENSIVEIIFLKEIGIIDVIDN